MTRDHIDRLVWWDRTKVLFITMTKVNSEHIKFLQTRKQHWSLNSALVLNFKFDYKLTFSSMLSEDTDERSQSKQLLISL